MEAQKICEATGRDFNRIFRRQYFLSEGAGLCPEGWKWRKLGG